jgi:hypothetical protein
VPASLSRSPPVTAWRTIGALTAWTALVLQYGLMTAGHPPRVIAQRTVNFLSFFTIESNLLAAVLFAAPVLAPRSSLAAWSLRPGVRGAAAVYIAVVGLIYHLVLRSQWDPQGLERIADDLLHYAVPLALVLDWALFTPHGRLGWRAAVFWLAVPVAYGAWTLAHGAMSGWYPYPFANAANLGYLRVLLNLAGLLAVFFAIGLGVVAIDRGLGRLRRR